jgi:hypothetical protein
MTDDDAIGCSIGYPESAGVNVILGAGTTSFGAESQKLPGR